MSQIRFLLNRPSFEIHKLISFKQKSWEELTQHCKWTTPQLKKKKAVEIYFHVNKPEKGKTRVQKTKKIKNSMLCIPKGNKCHLMLKNTKYAQNNVSVIDPEMCALSKKKRETWVKVEEIQKPSKAKCWSKMVCTWGFLVLYRHVWKFPWWKLWHYFPFLCNHLLKNCSHTKLLSIHYNPNNFYIYI